MRLRLTKCWKACAASQKYQPMLFKSCKMLLCNPVTEKMHVFGRDAWKDLFLTTRLPSLAASLNGVRPLKLGILSRGIEGSRSASCDIRMSKIWHAVVLLGCKTNRCRMVLPVHERKKVTNTYADIHVKLGVKYLTRPVSYFLLPRESWARILAPAFINMDMISSLPTQLANARMCSPTFKQFIY